MIYGRGNNAGYLMLEAGFWIYMVNSKIEGRGTHENSGFCEGDEGEGY